LIRRKEKIYSLPNGERYTIRLTVVVIRYFGQRRKTMTVKERLHVLIDRLPEEKAKEAEDILQRLSLENDPLWRALQEAPEDDEPLTPEEVQAIEEGYDSLLRGEVIPMEKVHSRLKKEC